MIIDYNNSQRYASLAGVWELALSEQHNKAGIINLPGTTDEAQKGELNNKRECEHLSRRYKFTGPAWYYKTISISPEQSTKNIELYLERTRLSTVWLDDREISSFESLSVPHRHKLGKLKAGEHRISICVNNDPEINIGGGHANSDQTQTNWNGILGDITLISTPDIALRQVRILSQVDDNSALVRTTFQNNTGKDCPCTLSFCAASFNSDASHSREKQVQVTIKPGQSEQQFTLEMGDDYLKWSEFTPNLYQLEATLKSEFGDDQIIAEFAMRDFRAEGTQFAINGLKTFLRGKHDACVFPVTGYAPMDLDSWLDYMKIMQEYGINHIRCHSWCLPEAAFRAADRLGLYLQPELPNWNCLLQAERKTKEDVILDGFGRSEDTSQKYDPNIKTDAEIYMAKEGLAILQEYGSYASFVMFALGNELAGNTTVMKRLVDKFRSTYTDKLYAQGSNNHFNDPELQPGDDYWSTFSVKKYEHDSLDHQVRASFSYANQANGGAINALVPGTEFDYSKAIEEIKLPIVGHETGQYQFFPDFDEMDKYTGVLEACNVEISQELMRKNGILEQWKDFNRATGRFASLLYKEDMEQGIRTPGFAGFQLLDLQDFPGQGTALIGILDAFMENKGHITPDEWRASCDQVTILGRFKRYTWHAGDKFTAAIQLANFGPTNITDSLNWEIVDENETVVVSGSKDINAPQGELTTISKIAVTLPDLQYSQCFSLNLSCGDIKNSYPLWVYTIPNESKQEVEIIRKLDQQLLDKIATGGNYLWMPDFEQIESISYGGLFMTDYWSFSMFKTICEGVGKEVSPGTMGMLIQNEHPALSGFPSDYHSNWQWRNVTVNSRPIRLAEIDSRLTPIVQPIDNMWRHEKLGLLFEFKLGKGNILCASTDFATFADHPENQALQNSLKHYINSENFNPNVEIKREQLARLV